MGSTASKVRHVRAARIHGSHTCHWPGCDKIVPTAHWGCQRHWFSLPGYLRRRIWATYRVGQEIDKRPSREYLQVAHEVQEWIGQRERGAT